MNENQFGVILENILDKVNGLAEGQKVMQDSIDRIETRLDGVETRLDRVEIRLDRVEIRLDRVEIRLDRVENDVARIDRKLDVVIQQTAGLTENVNNHEKRISKLEQNQVSA